MEKQKKKEDFKRKKDEKEQKEKDDKEQKEKEQKEKEKRDKEEKIRLKTLRVEQNKIMRLARQKLRKLTITGFQNDDNNTWKNLEAMNDDVEFLCQQLSAIKLDELSEALLQNNATESKPNLPALSKVKETAKQEEKIAADVAAAEKQKIIDITKKQKAKTNGHSTPKSPPWTKEELATLAKCIKKFPPGGGNRWETIANFINNSLQLATLRTKEECIAQYNSHVNTAPPVAAAANGSANTAKAPPPDKKDVNDWTEEQDRQLQEGLKKFPASMDKAERWTSIAKGVTGKGKKGCVLRFKAIRIALKSGKGK